MNTLTCNWSKSPSGCGMTLGLGSFTEPLPAMPEAGTPVFFKSWGVTGAVAARQARVLPNQLRRPGVVRVEVLVEVQLDTRVDACFVEMFVLVV